MQNSISVISPIELPMDKLGYESVIFFLGFDHKRVPDDAPGSSQSSIYVVFWKDFYLSKASLIAFSVPRWLIMLLLPETTEQGYIEVG